MQICHNVNVLLYVSPSTLIFENFRGGGVVRPVRFSLNPRLDTELRTKIKILF